MLYAECGIGNPTLLSTEVELGGTEYRVSRFVVGEFVSVYVRVWIVKYVFIIDSREGFKMKAKDVCKFKFLFGIQSRRV